MKSPTKTQIKKRRQAVGLTQTEAAETIGAALRTWQHWEGGTRTMPAAKWELFTLKVGC